MTTTTPRSKASLYDQAVNVLADSFISLLQKGVPFYKVNNISLKKLDHYYSIAYNFYSSEKYSKAKDIFSYIVSQNCLDKKSWMGIGGCCQMLGEYPEALAVYNHLKLMSPGDPVPYFHSFTCYLKLKKNPEALASLEGVILRSLNKPEHAKLKQQAEILKKTVFEITDSQ